MSVKRPDSTFRIKIDGETKEVKMNYALHMELMSVVSSPENIGELLATNPGLRDYVVRRALTDKKRVEKEEDLIDLYEVDVELEAIDDLVVWLGDHILHFFTTSMQKVQTLGQKYEETIHQLAQSKLGLEDSDSKESSVGASTAANQTSKTTTTGDTPTTS